MNLSFEKVKKQHYVQRKLLANWKGGYCIYKNKSEYPFVFSENTTFYENDFYSYNNVTKEDYNFYYEKCHDIIAFFMSKHFTNFCVAYNLHTHFDNKERLKRLSDSGAKLHDKNIFDKMLNNEKYSIEGYYKFIEDNGFGYIEQIVNNYSDKNDGIYIDKHWNDCYGLFIYIMFQYYRTEKKRKDIFNAYINEKHKFADLNQLINIAILPIAFSEGVVLYNKILNYSLNLYILKTNNNLFIGDQPVIGNIDSKDIFMSISPSIGIRITPYTLCNTDIKLGVMQINKMIYNTALKYVVSLNKMDLINKL